MRLIKKIHILVLKSFATLFVPSLMVIIFVLILQVIWVYADDWIGKGMSLSIFGEMMYYVALTQVPLAMPLAVMLASIISFGAMGENFELTAIKSAGISLFRTMFPIFILAIILSFVSFFFANNIFPYALQKEYALIVGTRQMHPALKIQEGLFSYQVEGYVIRVGRKSQETGMMYDFMIYDHKNYSNNKFVVVADSGTVELTESLKFMIMTLYNGTQYEEIEDGQFEQQETGVATGTENYAYHKDKFKKQEIIIPLSGFAFEEEDASLFSNNYQVLNVSQLTTAIDSLESKSDSELEYFFNGILTNDLLTNQIKLRTQSDSANYLEFVEKLRTDSPAELKYFYNIDSAYNALSLSVKRRVLEDAAARAERISVRLGSYNAVIKTNVEWIAEHKIALNKKIVLAVACFIFFFIGAPLGSIIRKGGIGLPAIISVILFLVFYVLLTFGEKFARDGIFTAFIGIWLPIFIFLPLDMYLFYKATNDSVILNYDYYIDMIDKLIKKIAPKLTKAKNKIKNKK